MKKILFTMFVAMFAVVNINAQGASKNTSSIAGNSSIIELTLTSPNTLRSLLVATDVNILLLTLHGPMGCGDSVPYPLEEVFCTFGCTKIQRIS